VNYAGFTRSCLRLLLSRCLSVAVTIVDCLLDVREDMVGGAAVAADTLLVRRATDGLDECI